MAEEVNTQTDKQMLKHVKCFWCVYSILEAVGSNVHLTDPNLCFVMVLLPSGTIIPYFQLRHMTSSLIFHNDGGNF